MRSSSSVRSSCPASSFEVESKLSHAIAIVKADGIDGTPSIVVAGKYRVTGASAGHRIAELDARRTVVLVGDASPEVGAEARALAEQPTPVTRVIHGWPFDKVNQRPAASTT